MLPRVSRTAQIHRTTGETDIQLTLDLDGTGEGERQTGVGFFDHLLDAVARHGLLDLDVHAQGDLQTGPHHTVEDTGLALGQALDEALGDRAGIRRFGHAVVVMDEARASCALDISGRPYTALEGEFPGTSVFLRVDDRVFHTYSSFGRGAEWTGGSYAFLDLTALGRQEDWEEPKGRSDSVRGAIPDFAS